MSNLEIKSASGVILAATDEHDTLTAWAQSGALRGANLYGADLRGANLVGADLGGASLVGANLYGANLYGADLYGANLYEADLRRANLYGANLYGADLRRANLYGANLYGADLRGVEAVIDGGQDGRGWRVFGWLRDGQLMIKAGCRNFTLADARAHWGAADYLKNHDAATQAEMCARVELAVAVARARGWQFEDAALAKARGEGEEAALITEYIEVHGYSLEDARAAAAREIAEGAAACDEDFLPIE